MMFSINHIAQVQNTTNGQNDLLKTIFKDCLHKDVQFARYTSARIGGPVDYLLIAQSGDELEAFSIKLWNIKMPFTIIGGGSNVLVSDAGIRGVVLLNRARDISFDLGDKTPSVLAESGANFGTLVRKSASKGLSGLEWAVSIPGTVGGAVFGNSGAHNGDVAGSLLSAEIIQPDGVREKWGVELMNYSYRSSVFKREQNNAVEKLIQPRSVILAATFGLECSTPQVMNERMSKFTELRRRSQPLGASLGSIFKNPPGDFAGWLIDAAGLKGTRIGDAEISPIHANFFINHGNASAYDIYQLVKFARSKVKKKFAIHLDLEIELVGEWSE